MKRHQMTGSARCCFTAAAFCISSGKILLVNHRKLGIWLAPGGHLEANELPHQAALRELKEEIGIPGTIISAYPVIKATTSQNLPLPFSLNLHWISHDNYRLRLLSAHPHLPHRTKTWPKGCEQHLSFNYLVKPSLPAKLIYNKLETYALGWFTLSEVKILATRSDIKNEIKTAFRLLDL